MTYDEWMDQMEIEYVNGELQVIADEERAEANFEQWFDLVGSQFLESFSDELVEDLG